MIVNTNFLRSILSSLVCCLLLVVAVGCSDGRSEESHGESEGVSESTEHDGENETEHQGESHDESGEEDGTQNALGETYDHVRLGTRLILNYDEESNRFLGSVENVSDNTLHNVRVEVHLSNGVELGPTERTSLALGQKVDVSLHAGSGDFESYSAHAEVGGNGEEGEHSVEGSAESEHSHEEGEEH